MKLNLTPVQVDIAIESLDLEREAFYNLCFVTENDEAPRALEVKTLRELLDNGYTRDSLAYNFCVGVFAQQAIPRVFIRAKRSDETYVESFRASRNDEFYFVVIESKDLGDIETFNDFLTASDEYKLQFFSGTENTLLDRKIVSYYQKPIINPRDVSPEGVIKPKNMYINKAYDLGYTLGEDELDVPDYQMARLAYPEGAWIAFCGQNFPSQTQWLYKYLAKVDVVKEKKIPEFSTTSGSVLNNIATVGSGTTNQGIHIHEQVSLDWVKWALSRRVWNSLYTKDKINATSSGLDFIVNDTKQVLDVAVSEGIFSEYNITDAKLSRQDNSVSLKFSGKLVQSIFNAEVSGSLYY